MIGEYRWLILAFAVTKGIVLGVFTSVILNLQFIQALATAALSGTIGATGAVLAAKISVKEARKNSTKLDDVKDKLDANQRKGDK